jgi:putative membrane protein
MIPYLVTADFINTALSATLCFSNHVLYPTYESVPRVTALSPLDDQALAGVIMWVPGSIAYLLPAVVLTMRLFERQYGALEMPCATFLRERRSLSSVRARRV